MCLLFRMAAMRPGTPFALAGPPLSIAHHSSGSACRTMMRWSAWGHTHPSMAVVQANDELLEDPARLLLRQAPMRSVAQSVVEEVSSLSVLHCNGQMRRRQKHLVHSYASLDLDHWYSWGECLALAALSADWSYLGHRQRQCSAEALLWAAAESGATGMQ